MQIDQNNEKVIIKEYPNQHPPLQISVDSQKEYHELIDKIEELFTILQAKKIKYSYELKDETIIYITIGNQFDKDSILAVQEVKKELANFVMKYNQDQDLWNLSLITFFKFFENLSLSVFQGFSWLDNVTKEKTKMNVTYIIVIMIIGVNVIGLSQQKTFNNQYVDSYEATDTDIVTSPPNIEPEVFESPLDSSPLNTEPEIIESPLDSSQFNISETEEENQLKNFITNYYSLLDNGKYSEAWEKLSPHHQNKKNLHPEGFSSFQDYWSKTKIINIDFLESECKNENNQPSIKILVKTKNEKDKILCFYFIDSFFNGNLVINKVISE